MPLIRTTPPEKAEGKLAELYAEAEAMFGMVPDSVKMLGVSPAILDNQLQFVGYYRTHPALSHPLLASIRMLVSKACHSPFCQRVNTGLLLKAGFTEDQIAAMQADPKAAPLSEKDRALLMLVLKATDDPHSVTADDVDRVRSAGWSEMDIFDAVAHGARMVAGNMILDTFKVLQS